MPMQEFILTCPCCGRCITLRYTENSVAVKESEQNILQIATDLGIELGVMKGGEEIGD